MVDIEFRRKTRECVPEEKLTVKKAPLSLRGELLTPLVREDRSDLRSVLRESRIYLYPGFERETEQLGAFYWMLKGREIKPIGIVIDTDVLKNEEDARVVLEHEACHELTLKKLGVYYAYLSEESVEVLAELCRLDRKKFDSTIKEAIRMLKETFRSR